MEVFTFRISKTRICVSKNAKLKHLCCLKHRYQWWKKNDWFFNSFFSCTFLKSVCKNSNFYLQTSMSLKCLGFFKISYSTHFCIFSRIPCGHDIKHCNNIFYLFSLVEYFTRVIITTILLRSMKLTLIPFVEIIWRLQLHSALLPNEYNVPFNNSLNSQMPWK